MAPILNYLSMISRVSLEEFEASCPFFFLLGKQALRKPRVPRRTDVFESLDSSIQERTEVAQISVENRPPEMMVLAVRKVHPNFPEMITVGRTANNDIVVADVNISRFHAFFQVRPERIEIGDAGSANGTFLNSKPLPARGATMAVKLGDEIQFAHLPFTFLDSKTCWQRVKETSKKIIT